MRIPWLSKSSRRSPAREVSRRRPPWQGAASRGRRGAATASGWEEGEVCAGFITRGARTGSEGTEAHLRRGKGIQNTLDTRKRTSFLHSTSHPDGLWCAGGSIIDCHCLVVRIKTYI